MSVTQTEVNEIFTHVAGLIPGDWFWKPNPKGGDVGGHLNDRATGMSLYAHVDKEQFHIYPQAPKDSRGQIPHSVSNNLPQINVSLAKPFAGFAKIIESRLLKVWEPRYQKALKRIAESNDVYPPAGQDLPEEHPRGSDARPEYIMKPDGQLFINERIFRHTCSRGHQWLSGENLPNFSFQTRRVSGEIVMTTTGPVCMECIAADLREKYRPVTSEFEESPVERHT